MKKLNENLFELQSLAAGGKTGSAAEKRTAELRAAIPEPILAHYDRLRARGKKGVAVIRNQVCSACHVQVPRNTVLTLMNGADLQICESCGCYLCLPEHEQPAPAPEKKAKRPRKPKNLLLVA